MAKIAKLTKKEELEDELDDLKDNVMLLEAQLHTLTGMLLAKGIIDDKGFQDGVAEMVQYIKKEEFASKE